MIRILKYIVWILVLLCNVLYISAQTQVSVTATANRKQILIGEQIQLTLEAKLPLGVDMSWFPLDSIPHFDFVEKGKIDSSVTEDGKTFRQDVLITSFDSGTFVIQNSTPTRIIMISKTYWKYKIHLFNMPSGW